MSFSRTARPLSRVRSNSNINLLGGSSKKSTPLTRTALNLDATIATGSTSNMKLKSHLMGTPHVDHQLELDFAYNDYLQALVKRQLVQKEIGVQKIVIEQQFMNQKDLTREKNKKYLHLKNDITQIERLIEIEELLKVVQECLAQFNGIVSNYQLTSTLNQLFDLLTSLCNCLKFNNVKPIDNQEDYDRMIKLLKDCTISMERILNTPLNIDGISEAAAAINDFNDVKDKFDKTLQEVSDLGDQNVYSILSKFSAMFAQINCQE